MIENIKTILINKKHTNTVIIVLVVLLALLVRLYNFENRVTFWSEQARSLSVSAGYIQNPSLLGQEYFRATSMGHKLFASPIFNYSLIPLQVLFKHNVIAITAYFALLNVATGIILYFVIKKIAGYKVALFSTILFLFSRYMIYHSMFIWILNYLPIIGILSIYFLYLAHKRKKYLYASVLGLLSGLGFGFEYVYLFLAAIVYVIILCLYKNKIKATYYYIVGGVLGNLPMVVFDLRNNFYHTRTLWRFFTDFLSGTSGAGFTYYHFLALWPLAALIGGYVLARIYSKSKFIAIILVGIFVLASCNSRLINFEKPTGMPDGLNTQKVLDISKEIAKDKKENYNVAAVLDFDSQAHVLRYPLEYLYESKPMGVENYPSASTLYILSNKTYDYEGSTPWELESFDLNKRELIYEVDENYDVYRIEKQ